VYGVLGTAGQAYADNGRKLCESGNLTLRRGAFTGAAAMTVVKDSRMCNQSEWIVREAFLAYDRGDVARMMEFFDPDLEWTYLDPGLEDPQPQTCRGRGELEKALLRQAERGLRTEIEQVIAAGEKVILVMRTPGVDACRHRQAGDRTYDVVTVRDGMIVGLHTCRDHSEARSLAGIG
jgi:ketosteroid isomerase-like protein